MCGSNKTKNFLRAIARYISSIWSSLTSIILTSFPDIIILIIGILNHFTSLLQNSLGMSCCWYVPVN